MTPEQPDDARAISLPERPATPAFRLRFSMADVAMLIVAASAASALFAKIHEMAAAATWPTWKYDSPTLVVLAIVLTAVALGPTRRTRPGRSCSR